MKNIKTNLNFPRSQEARHPVPLRGFTLIEVIVSIGIFAMLTTLVYANFRQGEKQEELNQSALELADNLRRVQNLGMSGQVTKFCHDGNYRLQRCQTDSDCVIGEPTGGECAYGVPKGGYGVYMGSHGVVEDCPPDCPLSSYSLFIDLDGTLKYDTDLVEDDLLPGGEDYALLGDVVIKDYGIGCAFLVPWCPSSGDRLDVVFMPPKPTPWADTYEEEKVIYLLLHRGINKCAQVSINGFSGDISVDSNENCIISFE